VVSGSKPVERFMPIPCCRDFAAAALQYLVVKVQYLWFIVGQQDLHRALPFS
jgi:hypothetical protein